MTKLLIDGDIVLYSSSSATEFACDWGGDNWVLSANLQQSIDIARQYIDGLLVRFEPDEVTVCLSGPENFRKRLFDGYKSNRKDTRKPIVYNPLKDWMMETYQCAMEEHLEADDLMGIMSNADTIIVSADKDMQCVPGRLFRKDEILNISLQDANRYHMLQTLTGDPTDGYKGCPGVGAVGAEKALLGPPEGHWEAVCKLYEKAGLTEADALLNARMAYILRADNYDFQTGEITLWEPPTGSR